MLFLVLVFMLIEFFSTLLAGTAMRAFDTCFHAVVPAIVAMYQPSLRPGE
jgi:hypothetical protein